MDTLNEEIEGSFIGGAQDAGPGASPYHPTDLGEKIYDINTVVFNYTNFPTKRSETRNDMVHSLIKMLTKANRDLTYYISDLKQSKCIEPFCLTSKQDDEHKLFWTFIEKLCEEADAAENESKADEMLLKRCAYHGLNFAAPFIVMRHWRDLKKDGEFWCGEFETDEVDWRLAELITNMQYACQRHYFGSMAENYFDNKQKDASVNVMRRLKTIEGFSRLPEEFTAGDVMRIYHMASAGSARMKISRLLRDHIVDKIGMENGVMKYKKTGVMMI